MVRPAARRRAAQILVAERGLSQRRACQIVSLNRSTYSYRQQASGEEALRKRMKELAAKHRRFGLPRLHFLLKREGLVVNHKRTERIYQDMKLQLKNRRRKKQGSVVRFPRPPARGLNEVWSMDFVHDALATGHRLRTLTIVDDFSKQSPGLLVDRSIPGLRVARFLDGLPMRPRRIRCDNGPEFTSRDFLDWAYQRKIEIEFIAPGKPVQNCYIESFNARFRDECLNEHVFFNLGDARDKIETWRTFYNQERPHTSLNFRTPNQFIHEQLMRSA